MPRITQELIPPKDKNYLGRPLYMASTAVLDDGDGNDYCGNCVFWEYDGDLPSNQFGALEKSVRISADSGVWDKACGHCRRYPPSGPLGGTFNSENSFPKISAHAWCGEHILRETDLEDFPVLEPT